MKKFNPEFTNYIEKDGGPIKIIENSALGPRAQLELLMVYLGEKPACLFGDSKKRGEVKREIERVVQELGGDICFDFLEEAEKNNILYQIFVGKDKASLDRLKDAFVSGTGEELGIALGYPESAAKAFQEGRIVEDHSSLFEELPKEKRRAMQTSIKFSLFGFSSDKHQEEMEVVKKIQATVQENSPEIYRRIASKD
jgi:hypothetical protein